MDNATELQVKFASDLIDRIEYFDDRVKVKGSLVGLSKRQISVLIDYLKVLERMEHERIFIEKVGVWIK